MNSSDNTGYDPAHDENQGVITKLVQGETANDGVPQMGGIDPVTAQGPEPIKEEVNNTDTEANGVNDDLLAEEDVAAGNVAVDNNTDDQ